MLCPEVCNFPMPKSLVTNKTNLTLENVQEVVNMNCFYKSVVISLPDELHTPSLIAEAVNDIDYYRICGCPLTVFMEPNFIENFVKKGQLYCLTADKDCVVDACAAITPDGVLSLHIPDFQFQCLGLEGVKRPHNFYETKIDLKNSSTLKKAKLEVAKLGKFDFYVFWEPHEEDICPSSLAKYFYEQNLMVTMISPEVKKLSPDVNEIPGYDAEPAELAEWLGMLALECNLSPEYDYVSSYTPPESESTIKSSRISLMILKGFFTPNTLNSLCERISSYVTSREIDNYWASISIQSHTDCPWRWKSGSPSTFQSQDTSTSVFFTKKSNILYSIGEIKFS